MQTWKEIQLEGESSKDKIRLREMSLTMALKCAGIKFIGRNFQNFLQFKFDKDLGHGAKHISTHLKWSRMIIEEFYNQVA